MNALMIYGESGIVPGKPLSAFFLVFESDFFENRFL
jgi:hypothetical protein